MTEFSITTTQKICKSVDEFCFHVPGHNIRPLKIQPGEFNSFYSLVEASNFFLMIRQVEHKYYEAGEFKEGSIGFIFIANPGSVVYNGRKYKAGEKLVTQGSKMTAILSTNLRMTTCFIESSALADYFNDEEIEQFHASIKKINHHKNRIKCDDMLANHIRQLIMHLSSKSLTICNKTMYQDLQEDIYLKMFAFATETGKENSIITSPKHRLNILNKALAYIHDHDTQPIRVSDLTQHVHTSHRNLQKIFHDYLETTPKSYLTGRRLNNIYHELLMSDPATTNIKTVSEKHGVIHQGNFARDYFSFFGEYPHETLKRDRHTKSTRKFIPC